MEAELARLYNDEILIVKQLKTWSECSKSTNKNDMNCFSVAVASTLNMPKEKRCPHKDIVLKLD